MVKRSEWWMKLLGTVCILVFIWGMAACSSPDKADNKSGNTVGKDATKENDTGKVNSDKNDAAEQEKISVGMFVSPPSNMIDLETNAFTQFAESEFGLDFTFDVAPSSDIEAKQSLLLASGDYPEIFWGEKFRTADLIKYASQGILLPLNDLIEEHAPNIKRALEEEPGVKEIAYAPDGKIYGLPSVNFCMHCYYASKIWIDTEFMESLGLAMPTTTEELREVLQAFKDAGRIPLTGATNGWKSEPMTYLMNAFTYTDGDSYLQIEGGELVFAPITPGWREGLRYINELYEVGLVDNQTLSQDSDTMGRLVNQGEVGAFASGASNNVITDASLNPDYKNWRTLPPVTGPDGTRHAAFYGNGMNSASFVLTNKATTAQQIAAIKLLNFVWTAEGTTIYNFGEEGKNWNRAKEGQIGLDGQQALFDINWSSFYAGGAQQNDGWDQMGPVFQSKEWRDKGLASPMFSAEGSATHLHLETMENYVGLQPKEVVPATLWIPEDLVEEYAMLKTNIDKYREQYATEFMMGARSIDTEWDTYVQGYDNLQLDRYLEIVKAGMNGAFDTSSYQPDPELVKVLSELE